MIDEKVLKFIFVGDVHICDKIERSYEFTNLLAGKKIYEYFKASDLVIANLEAPISDRGKANIFKHTSLRISSDMSNAIHLLGVDVCSLANNHMKDYGKDAYVDTLNYLKKSRIHTVGIGDTLYEAKTPLILTVKELAIGILNYTSIRDVWAGIDNYGTAREIRNEVVDDIKNLKKSVDIIIILLHTGVEFSHVPTKEVMNNCHEYIDVGADIVVCHHPHVLQGIEEYGNGIIAYSLGNFIFDPRILAKNDCNASESVILSIEILPKGNKKFQVEPVTLNEIGIPNFIENVDERLNATKRFQELCNLLDDNKLLVQLQKEENIKNSKFQLNIVLNEIKRSGFPYLLHLLKTRRIRMKHLKSLFYSIIRLVKV